MAHDPLSAIFAKTYEDIISLVIPRPNGVIQSDEIQVSQNRYNSTGTIVIKEKKMNIKLFYDVNQIDPDSWNGKYNLKSR